MWLFKEINVGKVKEGTKTTVTFQNDNNLKIENIVVSCGCLKDSYDQSTGILKVTFKAEAVPKHLRYKGEFITKKSVKVYSKENGKEELFIKAIIQMPHIYKQNGSI